MLPERVQTPKFWNKTFLEFHVFTGANGEFTMTLHRTVLRYTDSSRRVFIGRVTGSYAGALTTRSNRIVYHGLTTFPSVRVNAVLPTPSESECVNPVEFYSLVEEAADQPKIQKLDVRAFVTNSNTNAEWGVQFLWPLKMDYKILFVSDDYTETLVGHPSRKYLWVMSRDTELPRVRVEELLKLADKQGFTREGIWYPPYTPGFQMTESRLREIVQGKKLK